MKYYIREVSSTHKKTAWGKAREDINTILNMMGFNSIDITMGNRSGVEQYLRQVKALSEWDKALNILNKNDTLLIQYPPIANSVLLSHSIKKVCSKGVHIILVIHDIVPLLEGPLYKKILFSREDTAVFNLSEYIIVHNEHMAEYIFRRYGVSKQHMISLGLFDYLIDDFQTEKADKRRLEKDLPVIIAGNLKPSKAGYIYDLPHNCEFNLYGTNFIGTNQLNVHYNGSFSPDDLPYAINGSFGLIWDGPSSESCIGDMGEYLKLNNPHKTSLYLASGIPIIIWSQAALSRFILENHCGIAVDSLAEIPQKVQCLSNDEYEQMKLDAAKIGKKLRFGEFMRKAVESTQKY